MIDLSEIAEVRTAYEADTNLLLGQGWLLLGWVPVLDHAAKYILGKPGERRIPYSSTEWDREVKPS